MSAVAAGGGLCAAVDLRTRRVPNAMTAGLATLGVAAATLHATSVSVTGALVGCGLGVLLMLPAHLIGATGAGDVKLLGALGAWLGPARTGSAFVYAAIAGGALAVAVAMKRRRVATTVGRTAALVRTGGANAVDIEHASEDNRFAYAPAIAVGALAAAVGL